MTPSYNEDTLVQQTTAEYLVQYLGWLSVYAYSGRGCWAGWPFKLLYSKEAV